MKLQFGNAGNQLLDVVDFSLTGEVADRFGKRHAEKFKFLGV